MQTESVRKTGTILFLAGVLLGLALAMAAVWGDFEGMSYFYSGAGYPAFNGLRCPVLMTRSETAQVTARFDNPSSEAIQPYYEVQISGIASTRSLENQITVPAHSSQTVSWTVNARDVDLGSFVMIDMQVLPTAGFSTREATCGMLLVNLPGVTGGQLVGWMLGLSLVGLLLGLMLREGTTEPMPGKAMTLRNGLRALGIAVLLAMLTGIIGWWLFGILFIAGTLLLLVILLRVALM